MGRRTASELLTRDAAQVDPAAAAYVTLPPGPSPGYQDCFDAFVADTYRAIEAGSSDIVDGLPTFADGARAAHHRGGAALRAHPPWEDVPGEPRTDGGAT